MSNFEPMLRDKQSVMEKVRNGGVETAVPWHMIGLERSHIQGV